jgi:hypothetical protein
MLLNEEDIRQLDEAHKKLRRKQYISSHCILCAQTWLQQALYRGKTSLISEKTRGESTSELLWLVPSPSRPSLLFLPLIT